MLLTLFLVACGSPTCESDADCPGEFACGAVDPLDEPDLNTGEDACYERCAADDECKAGSVCLDDGTCGSSELVGG